MKAVFIVFAHTDVELNGSHTMRDIFLTFHWSVQLTPQIKLPFNVIFSKPLNIRYDKLSLLLSFLTANQTTITIEMADGKRKFSSNGKMEANIIISKNKFCLCPN